MDYRVLIPTAGTGSRLGGLTKFINKSLITIGNKPAISYIIEKFPVETEYVIPVGYKGELVKEFLKLAYPERKFYFADVNPYEGEGSGLGLSILSCKEYLQQPFIFCSCDTIVKGDIPQMGENWMGYADRQDIGQYRTLLLKEGIVTDICEKGKGSIEENKPYIGLAGIFDYKNFWLKMEENKRVAIQIGESFGLKALLDKKPKGVYFDWYDTGNLNELEITKNAFKNENAPNILDKANEAIWFMGNKVIKYSDDTKFITERVKRAQEIKEYIPQIEAYTNHMYSYQYVKGKVMSEVVTLPNFKKLLDYSKEFWKETTISDNEKIAFLDSCMKFYKTKTFERVELFYKNFKKQDGEESINGVKMPTLKFMLDKLDWEWISDGTPGRFHGDYHFENILYDDKKGKFIFLDWRQNFGGSITIGDIYYDFAKLLHGFIICHELIAKEYYLVDWNDRSITYDFYRKQILVECEGEFYKWLFENGYDVKKAKALTAIVYLNIAALHHNPYGLLLFSLGKKMLFDCLYEK